VVTVALGLTSVGCSCSRQRRPRALITACCLATQQSAHTDHGSDVVSQPPGHGSLLSAAGLAITALCSCAAAPLLEQHDEHLRDPWGRALHAATSSLPHIPRASECVLLPHLPLPPANHCDSRPAAHACALQGMHLLPVCFALLIGGVCAHSTACLCAHRPGEQAARHL